jgi:hypothetical protein
MSKNYEIQGVIHSIDETKSYGESGFTKREFVIKITGDDENSDYPQYAPIELIKDKCDMMNGYSVGQEVKIQFNINGRLWEGNGKGERCFSAFQAWKVESLGAAPAQQPSTPAPTFDDNGSDEIPF